MRVLILGLDAFEPTLIQRWLDDLPSIKSLITQGCWGRLRSAPNMNSAPAWVSFATGVQPGKHGIYYFTEIPRGTYCRRLINAHSRRAPAFWKYLSQQGIRVGVVNVPITFPAEPVNGFLIAGMDAPSPQTKDFCFPPEVFSQIAGKLSSDYCIEPRIHGMMRRQDYQAAMRIILNALQARLELVLRLTELIPVDVLTVVFTAADVAQHFFWGFMDSRHPHYRRKNVPSEVRDFIRTVYRRLDQAAGDLVDAFNPDLTIVLSDHGAGFNQRGGDFLFPWLQKLGLLHTTSSLWRRFWARLHRTDCPPGMQPWPLLRDVYWDKTKVYCVGTDDLFINLKGREPLGIVSPSERRALEEELLDLLRRTVDPYTHQPTVEYADVAERIYHGPYTHLAPDILIRWATSHILNGLLTPRYEPVLAEGEPPLISGGHRLYGVLILAGDRIRTGKTLEADITDVAPTLLHWLGLPVPDHYDGRVLTELFEPDWLRCNPVRKRSIQVEQERGKSPKDDETWLVEERLRDLGYID